MPSAPLEMGGAPVGINPADLGPLRQQFDRNVPAQEDQPTITGVVMPTASITSLADSEQPATAME